MLWAKSNPPRSLIVHCLDVAHAFDVHIRGNSVIRDRLEWAAGARLTEVQVDRLCVLAGLHDLGKAGLGFQRMLQGERTAWGHVTGALAALLDHAPTQGLLVESMGWFSDGAGALYAAICHHGGPVPMAPIESQVPLLRENMDREALEGLRELVAALRETYPEAWGSARALDWTPRLSHLIAGLVMASDWVGSGVLGDADTAYRQAGEWTGQRKPVLGDLKLNALQQAVSLAPTDARLLVVEAPTGTGKTEAALLRAEALAREGKASGLYFAVPTRSAASELHLRISDYLGSAVAGLTGTITRVLPGMIDTDGWQDQMPWHLGGSRQAMMARVGVGTIDQALLSILRARHAWMRRAWLCDRLLVVDEVHAGDAYMRALVERLTASQLAAGGWVLVMSATLGSDLRARLLDQPLPPLSTASATPYPCLWQHGRPQVFKAGAGREIIVEFCDNPVTAAMAAAKAGACVLMIRSTVADAVADYHALEAQGAEPLLHHSRWAASDRMLLDQWVLERLGKATRQPGAIVIGTQTVEQSLDIDADLLITDACPADVLLQRLGRLHRHERQRAHGYTRPRCLMIDPGPMDAYLTGNTRRPQAGRDGQGWAWVYPVLPAAATLNWLRETGAIRVPDDNRVLVESATHPEALAALATNGERWETAYQVDWGAALAGRRIASASWIDEDTHYAPDMEPEPQSTRLAIGTVTVETQGLRSPLNDAPIEAIPVPARWLKDVAENQEALIQGQSVAIGPLAMTYGKTGLQRC